MLPYKFGDLSIKSNVPLGINQGHQSQSNWLFTSILAEPLSDSHVEWFHQIDLPNGKPWLLLGKLDGTYLFRFHGFADFHVFPSNQSIECYHSSIASPETVSHFLIDQVLPRLLHQQGRIVIHASAVIVPSGVIAFLGETGWGKSTLAASLCADGFPHLTDDCLLIDDHGDDLFATPTYSGFRLWPDSISAILPTSVSLTAVAQYTEKKRVTPMNGELPFQAGRGNLRAIFILSDPENAPSSYRVIIDAVSQRSALSELVKQTYRLDISDTERLKQEFASLSNIAAKISFYRLAFPRNLSNLPSVRKSILDYLAKQPSPAK